MVCWSLTSLCHSNGHNEGGGGAISLMEREGEGGHISLMKGGGGISLMEEGGGGGVVDKSPSGGHFIWSTEYYYLPPAP